MSFANLPAELYDSIFCHISLLDLQQTALAVTRAIPISPVPLNHLFHAIRIKHDCQAIQLYRQLRLKQTGGWIKSISIEAWTVDADVALNLLRLLPNLISLTVWIGPNNFSPEHLEELLLKPFPRLRYLSLRFRPYVQRATYYQFHKGAYFDSALLALSRWPSSEVTLPALSIVQDPLDPAVVPKQSFAQPIVFFRLDTSVSSLLHSPAISASLRALRLRIPSRPVARSLCVAPPLDFQSWSSSSPPDLFFLDLSTCGILEGEIDMIIARFPSLKHLILDGCSVLRDLHEGEWHAMGKRCALVGAIRAKDREKAWKAWLEANMLDTTSIENLPAEAVRPNALPRRARPGRRGLATANISLRDTDPASIPSDSITTRPSEPDEDDQHGRKRAMPGKIRVLPPAPTLLTLSTTLSPTINSDKHPAIRAEFEAGWAEGLALLRVTYARLRSSAKNGGVRVMRFSGDESEGRSSNGEWFQDGLRGLEDIDQTDMDAFSLPEDDESMGPKVPILCLVGPGRDGHEIKCSHSVSWDIIGDEA